MQPGYAGKLLRIDLGSQKMEEQVLDGKVARQFIGGSGLGAKLLYEETSAQTEPLAPENLLIFATGPLTGTAVFSSDRFEVITKSPLTRIYAESNCGGRWAEKLKRCGYDGIIVEGRAEKPIHIVITENKVLMKDAAYLWGRDTFDTAKILEREVGPQAQTVCIGQAGEKLVKFAAIMTGGSDSRAAGRCGVGAVMGSKNLKAITVVSQVTGRRTFEIAREDRLRNRLKELAPDIKIRTIAMKKFGTSNGMEYLEKVGDLPIRNWYQGNWEGVSKISGQAMARTILTKRYHCGRCIIGCGRTCQVKEGPYRQDIEQGGPEYETLAMLGANCLVDDLSCIAKANELCNKYGLDTISCGGVIAFAMEAWERGLINKKDTGGVELCWGNGQAVIEMVEQITERRGFGDLLAEGVASAAEELGGNVAEFTLHVKRLELPGHDPRAKVSNALAYATSNRGACHLQAYSYDFEDGFAIPDLGYPETLDRFMHEGKAQFVMKMQNFMSMVDSLTCCKFVLFGGFTLEPLTECLNHVTGWNIDPQEFLRTGERIFTLKRMYNVRCGISRKDDTLPPRILTHRRGGGTNVLPCLNTLLSDYYGARGWDEFGIPTPEKLDELGLSKLK